jgi:hypothetical protein
MTNGKLKESKYGISGSDFSESELNLNQKTEWPFVLEAQKTYRKGKMEKMKI